MEEKTKAKKSIFNRWWFWLIVVVIVIGVIGSQGDSETNTDDSQTAEQTQTTTNEQSDSADTAAESAPVAELTPEEIKDAATSNDLMIWQSIKNTDTYYNNMVAKSQEADAGTISTAEFQAYCDEVADYTAKFREHLQEVDDPAAADYKSAAADYISNITILARDTKDFSETGSSDALESMQQGVQLISYCSDQLTTARSEYLKQAGFTDDEISATLSEE